MLNLTIPDWIANPSIPGFTGNSLTEKLISFAETRQIFCTNNDSCRSILAGGQHALYMYLVIGYFNNDFRILVEQYCHHTSRQTKWQKRPENGSLFLGNSLIITS